MDERRFDQLSRRIGALPLPALPRRAAMRLLGGATLTGALGLLASDAAAARKKDKNKDKIKDKDKDRTRGQGQQRGSGTVAEDSARIQSGREVVQRDADTDEEVGRASAEGRSTGTEAKNKKCKKEGKKCDKQQCKKKDKKCCCKDLKCKNDRCEGQGGSCPTTVDNDLDWGDTGTGEGDFNTPFGIATDDGGDVYVTDTNNERVQIFNANGGFEDEFGALGNEDDEFQTPFGIVVGDDNDGNLRVYVADPGQTSEVRRYRKFRISGTHEGNLGEDDLTDPIGVAIDSDNRTWVVNAVSPGEVFLFDDDGDRIASWTPDGNGELDDPEGIGVFEENNRTFIFVADTGNDRVVKFEYIDNSADGLEFLDDAGQTGSGGQSFNQPVGIAVDDCGNLWVADRLNNRIQQLDKGLDFETNFTAGFNRPTGVALSPSGNSLYVVDSENDRIGKYALD